MKAHLISAATALTLGYAAGFASDGLVAKAAVPVIHRVAVTKSFPNGNATIADVWGKVDAAMCAEAETLSGFDPGSCSVETGTVMSWTRGETETEVTVSFAFAATLTKGAPE